MLQQTIPLYLACEKALTIKASVRVTSPVNKFETLSNTTRGEGTSCRSANNSNMEPSRADVYTTQLIDIGCQSNVHIICVNKVEPLPQMQTYFKMLELNSVISNIQWLFYLCFVSDKTRNKTEEKQEITFLNNFSLFLLHSLFVLLLSPKILK